MNLHPGQRLESATCGTQVVVVRAPTGAEAEAGDVDLRCGGVPMGEVGSFRRSNDPESGHIERQNDATDATLVGKRYVSESAGIELLCTRGGAGSLTVGDEPLVVKGAKPLPSSD